MYTQIHLSRVIKVFIHSKVKVVKFGVFPIVDLVLQISKSNFSNVRERGGGQTSKEVTELGLLFFYLNEMRRVGGIVGERGVSA